VQNIKRVSFSEFSELVRGLKNTEPMLNAFIEGKRIKIRNTIYEWKHIKSRTQNNSEVYLWNGIWLVLLESTYGRHSCQDTGNHHNGNSSPNNHHNHGNLAYHNDHGNSNTGYNRHHHDSGNSSSHHQDNGVSDFSSHHHDNSNSFSDSSSHHH